MWNTCFCNHQRKAHSILGREFSVTFLSFGLVYLTNSGPVWMQNSYCLLLGHILGMGGLWFCRNSHVNFWIWYASDGLTFCSQIGCKKELQFILIYCFAWIAWFLLSQFFWEFNTSWCGQLPACFTFWPMCQQYIHSSNSVWLSLAPSINLFCLIYHLGNSQAKSKTTNNKLI